MNIPIREILSVGMPYELTTVSWNPADKHANISLTNFNWTSSGLAVGGGVHAKVRCTLGRSSGKWYWEYRYDNMSNTRQDFFGIAPSTTNLNQSVGAQAGEYSIRAYREAVTCNGSPSHSYNLPAPNYMQPGSIIMIALDLDNGKLWFGHNGSWLSTGDPAIGSLPDCTGISGTLYPAISHYTRSGYSVGSATVRFSSGSFTYPPPSGFTAFAG
jgi:hypothetical protein